MDEKMTKLVASTKEYRSLKNISDTLYTQGDRRPGWEAVKDSLVKAMNTTFETIVATSQDWH